MAITTTNIANMALARFGAQQITTTLAVEQSVQARQCRLHYDTVLLSLLRSNRWRFAIRRAALVESSSVPAFGRLHQFDLPSDCVRVVDTESRVSYEVEGSLLLTDESAANIWYITSAIVPDQYEPLFLECFVLRLAIALVLPVAGKDYITVKQSLQQELGAAMSKARSVNFHEEKHVSDADLGTWISARGSERSL